MKWYILQGNNFHEFQIIKICGIKLYQYIQVAKHFHAQDGDQDGQLDLNL